MRSINCAGEKSNNNNTSDSGGKLLVKLLPCLSNGCGVLHLVSSKSRTHYSIALTFSVVQLESTFIERMPCFFRGTTRINVYQKNALFFPRYNSNQRLSKECLVFSAVQLESTFIKRMPCFFRDTTRINVYRKNALFFPRYNSNQRLSKECLVFSAVQLESTFIKRTPCLL